MAVAVFPVDLILKILPKLPVKSLLRFSCVCKTWYSLISDHEFSKHRMRPCFLLCENLTNFSTIPTEPTIKDRVPTPLPLPWETEPGSKNIFVGSSNGLICVDHKVGFNKSSLILWNPSTRKFKRVIYPIWNYFNVPACVWFGYDESIHDYKIMWLSCCRSRLVAELAVFTLKSNTWTWRSVDHIAICVISDDFHRAYGLQANTIGVLSNGAIHWIVRYYPPYGDTSFVRILAVDLATEKFRLLNFSHASLGGSPWLGSLGGCLCLRVGRDLWVMEKYGVESSWKKLLSIIDLGGESCFLSFLFAKEEEGEEIVGVCNGCKAMSNGVLVVSGRIVKLRVEGGGGGAKKVVRFQEDLWCVSTDGSHNTHGVIILHHLHMEESLVSLS